MNEQRNIFTYLFLVLILISCKENKVKNENKSDSKIKFEVTDSIQNLLVDYKIDVYKIALGDNYKLSENKIDWQWAALNDPDNKVDSTGIDAFMFLGETPIKYNDGEYLPSLHIETDRNNIRSFTCSILFNLIDTTENETTAFLKLLSKDIQRLQNKDIVKSLVEKGFYVKTTQNYIETYKIMKARKYEYDKFEYSVIPREKNGR